MSDFSFVNTHAEKHMRRSHFHAVGTPKPSQLLSRKPYRDIHSWEGREIPGTTCRGISLAERDTEIIFGTGDFWLPLDILCIFGGTRVSYIVGVSFLNHTHSHIYLFSSTMSLHLFCQLVHIRGDGLLEFKTDDIVTDSVSRQNAINAQKCLHLRAFYLS